MFKRQYTASSGTARKRGTGVLPAPGPGPVVQWATDIRMTCAGLVGKQKGACLIRGHSGHWAPPRRAMGIPALPGLPTFKRHQKSDLMLILVI